MRSRFCLNTATIKQLSLEQQIRLASAAGFPRIGLWLDDIEAATSRGVPLDGIGRWIEQAGLKVEELCFLGGWQDAEEAEFPRVLLEIWNQHLSGADAAEVAQKGFASLLKLEQLAGLLRTAKQAGLQETIAH